jgi:general nucleoside transport system permease protein
VSAEHEADVLKRPTGEIALQIGSPVLAVGLAVLLGSVIVWAAGYNPIAAFGALLGGAFGGWRQIGETLLRSTPLIFTGLAVAYAFRAGLFNIGAEGQLFMGGLAAAWLGLVFGGLPSFVSLPLIIIGGALFGAAWAFIPALLKARVGAHEVITTMMFTYIARYIVSWLAIGPLKAPGPIPQTAQIPLSSRLPLISDWFPFLPFARVHTGFLLGIALALATWWILKYTSMGYEARAVGFNPTAAETGGASISRTVVKALCISGALAGLAGTTEVLGVDFRLFDQFSSGFGFTGIAVALLARNNPLGVIVAAILFGALSAGAGTMQLEADVPQKVVLIIQGLVIFFVAGEGFMRELVRQRARRPVPAEAVTADAE